MYILFVIKDVEDVRMLQLTMDLSELLECCDGHMEIIGRYNGHKEAQNAMLDHLRSTLDFVSQVRADVIGDRGFVRGAHYDFNSYAAWCNISDVCIRWGIMDANLAVGEDSKKKENNVKFISYDGKFPNMCSGTLILSIDGKKVTFGKNGENPHFWYSGVIFENPNDYRKGTWQVNESFIPNEYLCYKKELKEIVRKYLPQGCCGGCL